MSVSLVKTRCRVKREWFQCNLGLKVKVSNFPCAVRGYFLLSQWFSTRGSFVPQETPDYVGKYFFSISFFKIHIHYNPESMRRSLSGPVITFNYKVSVAGVRSEERDQ